MKIHIVMNDNPTAAEVTKGLQVMLMLSGVAIMTSAVQALHETFNEDDDTGTRVAPPPPPPPPPTQGPAVAVHVPPPPSAVIRDSTNLPHDPRIHSSKATVNKDGSWKAKKNVTPAEVASVTAELRAFPGNEAPAGLAPPPPATASAPPPPPPPPPSIPSAPANVNDFVSIMQKISGGLANGKLDQAKVTAALATVDLKQPLDLNSNAQQIPAVNAYLDAVMM